MKQRIALAVVAVAALAAIAFSEYRKAEVKASSAPIAYLIGDTEQELTRMPVTFTRISDEEEVAIGDRIAKSYFDSLDEKTRHDPEYLASQAYVEQVGRKLIGNTRRKLPYRFHYIPAENFVNAFALPGGHIFIGQGLISLMDSEDQLAAVLGHEVEHVDRVQLEATLKHIHLSDLDLVASIPYQLFAAGYSKEQELAADRYGTELAVDAGYSANGALRLFQKFERFELHEHQAGSPQEELATVVLSGLGEYFRSHPPSRERVAQVQQLITSKNWPPRPERDLQTAYVALNSQAREALNGNQYAKAIGFAQRSLKLKADQVNPREVLYSTSMYTGDFSTAASVAEDLVVPNMDGMVSLANLAEALAALHGGPVAANRFEHAVLKANNPVPRNQLFYMLDSDGLRLMGGDETAMRALVVRIRNASTSESPAEYQPPNVVGSLLGSAGRWYFLAGRYDESFKLLTDSLELTTSDPKVRSDYAWAALLTNKITIADSYFQGESSEESTAGACIVLWRNEKKDDAVRRFASLLHDSRWINRAWITAEFGPSSYATLHEIAAELDRRHGKPR